MAIITKNEINGKICSTCHIWKPLTEFPQIQLTERHRDLDIADAAHVTARKVKNVDSKSH